MPVNIECWRASIGKYNCIRFKLTHVPNATSYLTPSILSCYTREWINIICSLVILFVQILFLLSFIAISSEPILITCSIISDDYHCTIHQLITDSIYVPLLIIARFPRSRDAMFLIIDILRRCIILIIICRMLLMLAGDIESNPGPKCGGKLSFAVWNLNSLVARDSSKINLN